MPSLKDLRNRISSVKSTKKITSAMKMVAAAKLKRAQDNAEKTRPYALKMSEIVNSLVQNKVSKEFKFSDKKNKTKTILLIICSADRGLCGGFNGSIIKFSKKLSETKTNEGLKLNYIFVGKKAYNSLKKYCGDSIIEFFTDIANPSIKFELASSIRDRVLELFLQNSIDECHLIYTKFKSAISFLTNGNVNYQETLLDLVYSWVKEPFEGEELLRVIPSEEKAKWPEWKHEALEKLVGQEAKEAFEAYGYPL